MGLWDQTLSPLICLLPSLSYTVYISNGLRVHSYMVNVSWPEESVQGKIRWIDRLIFYSVTEQPDFLKASPGHLVIRKENFCLTLLWKQTTVSICETWQTCKERSQLSWKALWFHFKLFQMLNTLLLLTMQMIASGGTQDIRTLTQSKMNNMQYQCTSQNCVPSTVVYAANLRRCQLVCIDNVQCRTWTYNQSNRRCEMFADIPEHNGYLTVQIGAITLTAIDTRRLSARKQI